MKSLGFEIDENKLNSDRQVVFKGFSKCNHNYPLEFHYPSGFPSFPPTVISNVDRDLLLLRHHSPDTKVICCFGFGNERWKANYSGLDVFIEAETLITDYVPGNKVPQDDIVPEPIVKHYDYELGASLIIPPPFGDLDYNVLSEYKCGELRFSNTGRGILTTLESRRDKINLINAYKDWFSSTTIRKTKIYVLDAPPPIDKVKLPLWLSSIGINVDIRKNKESLLLFVFPDEWGKRGLTRPTWIALRVIGRTYKWIRCYSITDDERRIRNSVFGILKKKHVLLIGCGSLGSAVATMLAQEGVGKITLVDPEIYEPSNSIRHQVDQKWFGIPKVNALKERINSLSPETIVNPLIQSIGNVNNRLNNDNIIAELIRSDIVIDTTGNHSVSHYINSLCTEVSKQFVIGSVTNGAWSTEVVSVIPGKTGCWGCWNMYYSRKIPPSEPIGELIFAPGCNQPTFSGGISNIIIAAGLISQAVIDILTDKKIEGEEYLLWYCNNESGDRKYGVERKSLTINPDCEYCKKL